MKTTLSALLIAALSTALVVAVQAAEPTGLPGSCRIGQIACEENGVILRSSNKCVVKRNAAHASCGSKYRYQAKKGIDICVSEKKVKEATCGRGTMKAVDAKKITDLCYKKVRAYRCSWKKTNLKKKK